MKMRRRRARWILVGVAVLGLGIAGAHLLRPPPPTVPVPDGAVVPEEWFVPTLPEELPPPDADPVAREEGEAPRLEAEALPVGYVHAGRLVYELDGKRVAEETYRLERWPEGVKLASSGSFSARVLFVTVTVTFTQEIALDGDLRPRSYRLEARGPLWFGNRRIAVTVDGGRATATVGDEVQAIAVPTGNAFFVGTFAAYAVLPALYAAWADEDRLVLVAVGTRGGPGAPASAVAGDVEVTRRGTAAVEAAGGVVLLDRYRIRAGSFAGTLLAWGLEFVAFLGEGERVLTVYRADLFPRGIGPLPSKTR